MKVETIEELAEYVGRVGVCGIFKKRAGNYGRLWDVLAVPDEVTSESSRWGLRMDRIWHWKNELPARFPEEIFYGKMPGGDAVLMSADYLRERHFPAHHRSVGSCRPLARDIFDLIAVEPGIATGDLRRSVEERLNCGRSRFSTALTELQVTLNIARAPDSPVRFDRWLRFSELFPNPG